jgi:SHS2 domain-containing protein
MSTEPAFRGIVFLDHTADVGLAVTAPTLPELFIRTARGMTLLIHGTERGSDDESRTWRAQPGARTAKGDGRGDRRNEGRDDRRMTLQADDLPGLLRAWLRELLHWHQSEGVSFDGASFRTLSDDRLEATVTVTSDEEEPVREIKGVTLHGLVAEARSDGWVSQVIFDV